LFKYLFIIIFTLFFPIKHLYSFESKPYKTDFVEAKIIIASTTNNKGYGFIELKLKQNYKTYWKSAGEVGFAPYFTTTNSNLKNIEIYFLPPQRNIDEYGFQSYIYHNIVNLPFSFEIQENAKNVNFSVVLNFATCKDICVPNEANFNFTLPLNYQNLTLDKKITALFQKIPIKLTPKEINFQFLTQTKNNISISFNQINELNIDDIIVTSEDFIFYKPNITIKDNKIIAEIEFKNLTSNKKIEDSPLDITIITKNLSYELTKEQTTALTPKAPLNPLIFLFAFIGGLILNIMPCVLPVISLKIGQLTHAKSKINYHNQLLLTISGLIFSFLIIGILIYILKQAGEIVGWGFHFQNPIFITLMLMILIIFTFSQLNFFTLNLSNKSSGFLNNILNKLSPDNWLFHFLYGIIITLLATPCTAPFLGTSIAFALTQNFIIILGIFFAISLGLSFPYILLLLIPKDVVIIPKGGNWLNYTKYFATILLYGSCLWLYYVLIDQLNFLYATIIFISLHLMILGFIKTTFKKSFLFFLICLFAFLIYKKDSINHKVNSQEKSNLIWHNLDSNLFDEITIKNKKIIFIDITASWCLTCKFNEINVLSDKEVQNILSKQNIYLIKEDITKPNKKVMEFIYSNNKVGIPFYAIIKNGKIEVLSEILNKNTLINKLKY
jgi:suppressor for copper-sensitivity B